MRDRKDGNRTGRRKRVRLAVATLLLGPVAVSSSGAEPAWTQPVTLATPGGVGFPRLDRAPDGTSYLSYDTSGPPKFRRRSLGGDFGPEQSFPNVASGTTDIIPAVFGFADSGDAVVLWHEGVLNASYRTSAGSFGPVQTIGNIAGGYSYDLAVDTAGNAILVRVTSGGSPSLVFQTRPAGAASTFSAPQTITSGASSYSVAGLVLESDGRAALIYKAGGVGMQGVIKLPGANAFGSPQLLEAPFVGSPPIAAKNRAGRIVAIWNNVLAGFTALQWRGVVREPGSGVFAQTVDLAPQSINSSNGASVAIDSSGHGVALFAVSATPGPCGAQSATSSLLFSEALPGSAQFTFGTTVVPAGDVASNPSIAISDGRIAAMWSMNYGSDPLLCQLGGNFRSDLRAVVTDGSPPGLLASQVLVPDTRASFGPLLVADDQVNFTAAWLRSPGPTLAASSFETSPVFRDGFE